MTLNHKQLHNLPVYTRAQTHLGYVTGFDIDELDQRIMQYYVKTHKAVPGLFEKQLLISAQQVISLTAKCMVVEDLTQKATAVAERFPAKGTLPAGN